MFHKLVLEDAPPQHYVDRNQFSWDQPRPHPAKFVGCECGWWYGTKIAGERFSTVLIFTHDFEDVWVREHMRDLLKEGVEL